MNFSILSFNISRGSVQFLVVHLKMNVMKKPDTFLFPGLKGLGKHVPLIVGIIVVKFIALPAIGIGIVKGAVHFGLIHPDPLYQFLLLLQFALPPAVAISKLFMKLKKLNIYGLINEMNTFGSLLFNFCLQKNLNQFFFSFRL